LNKERKGEGERGREREREGERELWMKSTRYLVIK